MQPVRALTVDIHRLDQVADAEQGAVLSEGKRYIALSGSHAPPVPCTMELGNVEFLHLIHKLRYPENVPAEEVSESIERLGSLAAKALPQVPAPESDAPLQIDLVLGAPELWAFPFEACLSEGHPLFASKERPVILTRRIRQGFAAERRPWPVHPRVLFVHAPAASDLSADLIADHQEALGTALGPWSSKDSPIEDGILEPVLALGVRDIKKAMAEARDASRPFTHVHLLAHGKAIVDPITAAAHWGLRLGLENQDATEVEQVAEALAPVDGLPVVITLAVCDAGNQAQPATPKKSIAQALHARGVPIVLAPQLPLTQPGSVTLTRSFYEPLLGGQDSRQALHEARLALRADPEARHDWLSLVGYIQLPEGYGDHLVEVGIRRDLARLKTARKRLDQAMETGTQSDEVFDAIEAEVGSRIESLAGRLPNIPEARKAERSECHGVLASAHKRLAELLFRRARAVEAGDEEAAARFRKRSGEALDASLQAYSSAYRDDIHNHWLGGQKLSLEAVLEGGFEDPEVWRRVFAASELAAVDGDHWAYGTLAELWLLAPLQDSKPELDKAREELSKLIDAAAAKGDDYAFPSTCDQLTRYFEWWTKQHGFFGDRDDLAEEARELNTHLEKVERSRRNG